MVIKQQFNRSLRVVAAVLLFAGLNTTSVFGRVSDLLNTEKMPAQKTERELIDVLKTKSPQEKAIACKQLAIYGGKDAVPELAKLLGDKELASWARIALEANTDPSADEALIMAARKLHGELLVGTINSIGVRKSRGATEVLGRLVRSKHPDVASASAVALGHIGNDAATKILRRRLTRGDKSVRSAVAEGCILCAEHLVKEGKIEEAGQIYEEVRKAEVPKQRVLEATRGLILAKARQNTGIPLLVEQLHSPDKTFFYIGLTTAREMPGTKVTEALAAELWRISPQRQVPLLNALAARKDGVLPSAVLKAAKSGAKDLRIAAIGVIGRQGDSTSVSTLVEIAGDPDAEVASAAASAMAELGGKDVDAELIGNLSKAHGKALAALIQAIGQRRVTATSELIQALENSDQSVRRAALAALGETVEQKDVTVLLSQFVRAKNKDDAEVAEKALRAACVRMSDRDRCAATLSEAMSEAPAARKVSLLEILAAVGGAKSLETIGEAARGSDATLQDAATRALGKWMTPDAAPVLLALSKPESGCKFQSRAVRGYIRVARQFVMPDAQRIKMCENALAVADRDDDRKLVLEVLQRHPSMQTLKMAVAAWQKPGVKEEARTAAISIAQKLKGNQDRAAKLLAQIGVKTVNVEIVRAEYGAGTTQKDVTDTLQKEVRGFPVINLRSASYNKSFGGDPAPGSVKQLIVHYRIDGKPGNASFPENSVIMLPMPK
jgi:HEAT repeat protein